MHVRSTFSRRNFLKGGALAAGLGPLVPMLDSHADTDGIPCRLLIIYTPSGTAFPYWRPTGTVDNWELSHILSPLEHHKENIIVLDGVDDEAAHHLAFHPAQGWGYGGHWAISSLWSGQTPLGDDDNVIPAGITLDQHLAQQIGTETPFGSLGFGVNNPDEVHWKNQFSYTGQSAPVPPEDDPAVMLERIFGDQSLDEAARLKLREARLSVLDSAVGDLNALSSRMTSSDRAKMDQHLTSLRELEHQIRNGSVGCNAPELTPGAEGMPGWVGDFDNTLQLIVKSFACDATRVATLMFGHETSNTQFPFLDLGVPDDRLHVLSHEGGGAGLQAYADVHQYFATKFGELLDLLALESQAEGTLLDHTIVVWAGSTSASWGHVSRNVPVVIGGRGGGYFDTGKYHRYGSFVGDDNVHTPHGGRTMNDLHLSILHAMGYPDDTFGDPAFCTGPLL